MTEITSEVNQDQVPEIIRDDYESRERTVEDAKEPPKSWKGIMKHFGPSFVIMGATVGSGELIATTIMGAKVGYVMLWMLILGIVVKASIQEVFARYTISSGQTLMDTLDEVPGRIFGVSWAVWWAGLLMLSLLVVMAGIVASMGIAVQAFFGFGNANIWGLILIVIGILLLIRGLYADIENITVILVGIFSLITVVIAFFLIQATPYAYTASDIASGLTFSFPAEGWFVALAVFGVTGISANEVLTYTYWVRGKGYAAWSGPSDSQGFLGRAEGWTKVMRSDLVAGAILVSIVTVAFYILGAGVLYAVGKVPGGFDAIETISMIFTETVGGWTRPLFMVAAISILFTTYMVNTAGIARIVGDCLIKAKVIKAEDQMKRMAVRRVFTVLAPIAMLLLYYVVGNPTQLIMVGSFVLSLSVPVAAVIALILENKLKKEGNQLRFGGVGTIYLWMSAIAIIALILGSQFLG